MTEETQAYDCTCCEENCNEKAVAFWPIVDPDIPSYPYCRKHLDEAKIRLLIKIQNIGNDKSDR